MEHKTADDVLKEVLAKFPEDEHGLIKQIIYPILEENEILKAGVMKEDVIVLTEEYLCANNEELTEEAKALKMKLSKALIQAWITATGKEKLANFLYDFMHTNMYWSFHTEKHSKKLMDRDLDTIKRYYALADALIKQFGNK